MKVDINKLGKLEYRVVFGFGNQFFTLEYVGTKTEAKWMAKMLKKCFENYKLSLTEQK